MTLRTLILLAALCYTLVTGGGLMLYRIFVAYPEVQQYTLQAHKSDFQAIEGTYLNERFSLNYFNLDWAKWDDTYEFVRGNNPQYISSNIQSASFRQSNVDGIAILDENKSTLFAAIRGPRHFEPVNSLLDITNDIDVDRIFLEDESYGLIRVAGKLGYFCSHSISNSDESQPENGELIFIRLFDPEFLHRIQKLTNSKITFTPIDASESKPTSYQDIESVNTLSENYSFTLINHMHNSIGKINIRYPESTLPSPMDGVTWISVLFLILLPITITILVYIYFLKPMTYIFNNIGHMNRSGKLTNINMRTRITEIDGFTSSFNAFINQIKEYQKKLESESHTDGLTGLFNRRYFDQQYDEIWRTCTRNKTNIAIIMMDIDFFKKYNDFYGHQKGDDALKSVAALLTHQTRRANETLARYGGEEFVLVMVSTTQTDLTQLLDRILSSIKELNIPHEKSDIERYLTISCGACLIENPDSWMKDNKENALKIADDALYEAKENGRNRYTIHPFTPDQKANE